MRFLVTVSWPVAAGNAAARAGTLGETVQSILEDLKHEAVYFTAMGSERIAIMVINMADVSEMPAVAEP